MRTSNFFTTPFLLLIMCVQFINMGLKMQAGILLIGSTIMMVFDLLFLFQQYKENKK